MFLRLVFETMKNKTYRVTKRKKINGIVIYALYPLYKRSHNYNDLEIVMDTDSIPKYGSHYVI